MGALLTGSSIHTTTLTSRGCLCPITGFPSTVWPFSWSAPVNVSILLRHEQPSSCSWFGAVGVSVGGKVLTSRFTHMRDILSSWAGNCRTIPGSRAGRLYTPPSSRGPGHRPFKAAARVRIPLGAYVLRRRARAISSGVEHLPYKEGVAGSNPASPTSKKRRFAGKT